MPSVFLDSTQTFMQTYASNQGSQTLSNFAQDWQNSVHRFFGSFELNRHADSQRALHIAFVVTQRNGNASVGEVELLFRQRPILGANAGKFGPHAFGIGDGVRGKEIGRAHV